MKYKKGHFWTTAYAFGSGRGVFVKIHEDENGLYGMGWKTRQWVDYNDDYDEDPVTVEITVDDMKKKVDEWFIDELEESDVDVESATITYTPPRIHRCCSYECYDYGNENAKVEVKWPKKVYLTPSQVRAYKRQQELGPTWKEEEKKKRVAAKEKEVERKRKLIEKLKKEIGEE